VKEFIHITLVIGGQIMKKLFAVFIVFGLIFMGCPPDPNAEYSVIYHADDDTSGYPPNDNNKYKSGEEAIVLGQHTLLKEGYSFKNWNTNWEGTGNSYEVGDTITITRTIFLYAIWELTP
jgi:hypothetical protein